MKLEKLQKITEKHKQLVLEIRKNILNQVQLKI